LSAVLDALDKGGALSDNCEILRSVIETCKDQIEALEWSVKIKPDDQNKRAKATPISNAH
jgi:hypothetical protein